jgi:hypothetical protein
MRRTNAESSDTFTAKQGFFDRTLTEHTDRLGVSCRVQDNALIESGLVSINAVVVSRDLSRIRRLMRAERNGGG